MKRSRKISFDMSNLLIRQTKTRYIFLSFCLLLLITPTLWGAESNDVVPVAEPEKASGTTVSQDGLWQKVSRFSAPATQASKATKAKKAKRNLPRKYRMLELNVHALEAILRRAPAEDVWNRKKGVELTLPTADGGFKTYSISQTSMMEPELAEKYPELKTYTGVGIDDPTATLRISWTPRGIEIIVIGSDGTFFIDPFEPASNSSNYISYTSEALPSEPWDEELPSFSRSELQSKSKDKGSKLQSDGGMALEDVSSGGNWRTYRIAITTSQEYYTNNGDTDTLVLAAITNKVNQLNAIYERELSVRLTLVANNNLLLNKPYSDTTQNIACGGPNITDDIDAIISSGAYDLGHLFLWEYGGGVAYIGVVCYNACKADGQSGANASIDTVAHEIGHMFSMYHSWNNCEFSTQRTDTSAYEPGAGNSIMSYAGTCGTDNLLGDLLQFHVNSYQEADDYIAVYGTCRGLVVSGNTPPAVAGGTAIINIPKSTPFTLVGSASDLDDDDLSYSWEDYTLGPEVAPNTGTAPFFRVFAPRDSGVRTFPQISDIVNGTETQGEELPGNAQTLNFRLHVYDGRGGVSYDTPNTQVIVDGSSGPFQVTSPNISTNSWIPGATEAVTWDVAGTGNGTAVDCDNVAIDLSVDGGYTYTVPLISSTANDGSSSITVPGVTTTAARVRVSCADLSDHFFFDISDKNFVVDATPGTGECSSSASVGVNSLADTVASDGECTLREAVSAVSSGGSITFDSALVNGVITLGSEITIDKSMTIDGSDHTITISGGGVTRIFYIYKSGSTLAVALRDLTLTKGFKVGDGGGAIRSSYEAVTLERVVISNSAADTGGAIYHSGADWGPLTVIDSTFIENHAEFMGGAVRLGGNPGAPTSITGSSFISNQAWRYSNSVGGAIATWGVDLTIANSTFTENTSKGLGGAIGDYQNDGTVLTIRNSTFSDNGAYGYTVGHGVGSNIYHISSGGAFHLINSILSGALGDDCYTARPVLDTNVNNLIEDGSCSPTVTGDPLLGPLANNGGYTKTMALMAGSPALGAGSGCEILDQRGYTRDSACDIGAYEVVGCGSGSYSVPNDQWQIISLPCDPGASNTISDVLGDDLIGVYGTDWGLYEFDETAGTSGSYSLLSTSSALSPGLGYWLIKLNGAGNWSMETTDAINSEPFEIALTAAHNGTIGQQNMVGNPLSKTHAWADTRVLDTYGNCYGSPSIAATAGSVGVINNAINFYNGSSYTICDDTGTNPPCTLAAGEGFWVQVPDNGETNARLRIGGACESGSTVAADKSAKATLEKETSLVGWAAYLKVNAGPYEDPVNTLGQRASATIGYDRNDLKELTPDRAPFMTLVFPHPDWGDKAGDYGADYQPLGGTKTSEWYFVVHTSELLEDLTLSWQAPEDILQNSQLVDMDTGEIFKLKKLQSYTTEWYGLQERHFKWVLKNTTRKTSSATEN